MRMFKANFKKCLKNMHYIIAASAGVTLVAFGIASMIAGAVA